MSDSHLAGRNGVRVGQLGVAGAFVTLARVDVPHPVSIAATGGRGGHCRGGGPLLCSLTDELLSVGAIVVHPGSVFLPGGHTVLCCGVVRAVAGLPLQPVGPAEAAAVLPLPLRLNGVVTGGG